MSSIRCRRPIVEPDVRGDVDRTRFDLGIAPNATNREPMVPDGDADRDVRSSVTA